MWMRESRRNKLELEGLLLKESGQLSKSHGNETRIHPF